MVLICPLLELHPDVISTPPSSHRYSQQARWGAASPWHEPTMWHSTVLSVCASAPWEEIPWHEAMMGLPLMSKCASAWSSPNRWLWTLNSYSLREWYGLLLWNTFEVHSHKRFNGLYDSIRSISLKSLPEIKLKDKYHFYCHFICWHEYTVLPSSCMVTKQGCWEIGAGKDRCLDRNSALPSSWWWMLRQSLEGVGPLSDCGGAWHGEVRLPCQGRHWARPAGP